MAKSKFKNALENENVPYLIGETAYIHEGDFNYMIKLIKDMADKNSCDGIKFHIMIELDSYATKDHPVHGLIKDFLFSKSQWAEILKNTKTFGFETIVLVDDAKAIDFVNENIELVDVVELHACALNNVEMLEKIKVVEIPIILGIGGSKIEDIEFAIKFLDRKDILLMHGFQNYPTKYEYINFRRMQKAREKFKLQVGYADHTSWDNEFNEVITLAGFMAGANILEKHVVLKAGDKREDFESAIDIDMLAGIKRKMEVLNKAKGDGSFEIGDYENIYAKNGPMKFTIVASKDLKMGETIKKEDITFRRTKEENTIMQREYLNLLGKKTKMDIKKYELVNWENVER